MDKHLSRKELIAIAQQEPILPNSHIESCDDCHRLVYLLKDYFVIGKDSLPNAPSDIIKKAKALIQSKKIKKIIPINIARLTFDSWATAKPIGVRDESSMNSRRVRFEDDNIVLDIRAEQQIDGWSFVAQINDDSPDAAENILEIGKKKLHIDPDGFYQWTSKNPPKSISIHTTVKVIKIPELLWKNPR